MNTLKSKLWMFPLVFCIGVGVLLAVGFLSEVVWGAALGVFQNVGILISGLGDYLLAVGETLDAIAEEQVKQTQLLEAIATETAKP